MALKKHDRQYDLVVFGTTGYTGQYTAEHITTHLPTDLKWAIAGRSQEKLEGIAAHLKTLNADRRQPDIEICELSDDALSSLARKTYVLISTVGPFGLYGEHAFRACAESGTHYLDVTGEVPWVARMIKKYESAARANGALMFPQMGLESAPSDLLTWSLAQLNRTELGAPTRDVTISVHALNSTPSGGTLASVLTLFDLYPVKELREALGPFALSPVPNPHPPYRKPSLLSMATGLRTVPNLGLLTTSVAALTDQAVVGRSWGLMSSIPSRRTQFYGPNFTWEQFMKPRNWLEGIAQHYALVIAALLLSTLPPLRRLVRRFVYQPGQGTDREEAKKERVELRGVANPDTETKTGKQAFVRAWFNGSLYYLSGILLASAAETILQEEDLELEGGVLTASCLGQPLIDRLGRAGFKMEKKIIPA